MSVTSLVNRLLGLALFTPLIKAVRRYEAAARGKKVFERRPISQSLGARVDNLVAVRLILGPERHQAPAHRPRFTVTSLEKENRCHLWQWSRIETTRRNCSLTASKRNR
jgi:hypothetical protein